MSDQSWYEHNNAYLAASLRWLILLLEHYIAREYPDEPRTATASSASVLELPLAVQPPAELRGLAGERDLLGESELAPSLVSLARVFRLSRFEQDILLLCAAMELSPRVPILCARAQGDPAKTYPTFSLALALFDDPAWDALSPDGPLRHWMLLRINQPGGVALTHSPLGADERIVGYIKGLNRLDDRIASVFTPVMAAGDDDLLSASQDTVAQRIAQHWRRSHAASPGVLPLVMLLGSDPASKRLIAQRTSGMLERQLYRVGADQLSAHTTELGGLSRLWQRENFLLPLSLLIEAESTDESTAQVNANLARFLSGDPGFVFLGLREVPAHLGASYFPIDAGKPEAGEQRQAWRDILVQQAASEPEAAANALAAQFSLNLGDIRRVTRELAVERDALDTEQVWAACRDLTRPRLDRLAQRIEPKSTWDDLVLREEQAQLLSQVAARVRLRSRVYQDWGFARKMNRGLGISVLFVGEPGTGKTMAAEVLANDLRLNLYRIDLSAVVSKYIGETEKNLGQLFDSAEEGGAILFFDEADALFGKRSEVKDSHDRYANIEINYLLQRMESYRGLAILSSNMKSALDLAFMRRLAFIVPFTFPGPGERLRMWRKVFPPEASVQVQDGDFERLSRLNLTGANIHSIALNAAFLAAASDQAVGLEQLRIATQTELRKLEKPEVWI